MREKRRQKKGENESERVAGERRRERFAGYNRKAQLTHKYHLPGLAHLRVRERERERGRDFSWHQGLVACQCSSLQALSWFGHGDCRFGVVVVSVVMYVCVDMYVLASWRGLSRRNFTD